MSVKNNASLSAAAVLGTISTAAHSLTNTFSALGNAAEVFNIHSKAWVDNTREQVVLNRIHTSETMRADAALSLATAYTEREKVLDKDPTLKLAYERALATINEKLNPAT